MKLNIKFVLPTFKIFHIEYFGEIKEKEKFIIKV
jgi:hypothetical protein